MNMAVQVQKSTPQQYMVEKMDIVAPNFVFICGYNIWLVKMYFGAYNVTCTFTSWFSQSNPKGALNELGKIFKGEDI